MKTRDENYDFCDFFSQVFIQDEFFEEDKEKEQVFARGAVAVLHTALRPPPTAPPPVPWVPWYPRKFLDFSWNFDYFIHDTIHFILISGWS